MKQYLLLFIIVALSVGRICSAQTDDKNISRVTQVLCDSTDRAGLGDRITVSVTNLQEFLKSVKQNQKQIALFLNGMVLSDINPEAVDTIKNELRFLLRRTESTKDVWNALCGRPTKFIKDVSVSIGPKDGYPIATAVEHFHLIVIRTGLFYLFSIVLIFIIFIVFYLAWRTELLRDSGPKPERGERVFSLARAQMAFWFLLVICSYLFLWVVTKELDTISDSILILMGISAGTGLGAAAIDIKTKNAGEAVPVSKNKFFRDILSDSYGISLHRVQMAAWTLVLGAIFIFSVYNNLSMPEFGGTLLTLMGISSGTYLGFKVPENLSNKSEESETVPPVG